MSTTRTSSMCLSNTCAEHQVQDATVARNTTRYSISAQILIVQPVGLSPNSRRRPPEPLANCGQVPSRSTVECSRHFASRFSVQLTN